MAKNEYRIVDDFSVANRRVLVLDSDYEYGNFNRAVIDGVIFSYTLNSVRRWIIIDSNETFTGKKITFINTADETQESIAV